MFLTSSQTYNFYEMKKADKKEFVEQLFDIGIFGDMHQAIHRDILDADKRILAMQNRIMVFRRNDEEYSRHEVEFALPRAQCLELIPEHITGKLVNES